jgi:hypothetical protein
MRKFFALAFAGLLALGASGSALAATHNTGHHAVVAHSSVVVRHNTDNHDRGGNMNSGWRSGDQDVGRHLRHAFMGFWRGVVYSGRCVAYDDNGWGFRGYTPQDALGHCSTSSQVGGCYSVSCNY